MKIPVGQAVAIGALILVVLGGVVAFALSGRSTTSQTSTAAVTEVTTTTTPAAPSSAVTTNDLPPPQVMTSLENAAGIPPKPNTATANAYIAALVAIDPDIVHGKPDKAIDRGRNQCGSVKSHAGDRAEQIRLAGIRFTSPDHPDGFGPIKSAKILDAVVAHLCP